MPDAGRDRLIGNIHHLIDTFEDFDKRWPEYNVCWVKADEMPIAPGEKPRHPKFAIDALMAVQSHLGDGANGPKRPLFPVAHHLIHFMQRTGIPTVGNPEIRDARLFQKLRLDPTDETKPIGVLHRSWFVLYDNNGSPLDIDKHPAAQRRISDAGDAFRLAAMDVMRCINFAQLRVFGMDQDGNPYDERSVSKEHHDAAFWLDRVFRILEVPWQPLWLDNPPRQWAIARVSPNLAKACIAAIRRIGTNVIDEVDAKRAALKALATIQSAQSDGPFPPNGFANDGKRETISRPKVWKLINALWNAEHRTLDFADLAEPVWGDREEAIDSPMVSSLRRDANRFFGKHAMPFKIKTIGTFVSLSDSSD